MTRGAWLGAWLGIVLAAGLAVSAWAQAAAAERVDLELILLADGSGSIDTEEFMLQRQGYARALRDPRIMDAIRSGRLGRIALTYVEWSGPDLQVPIVPWTVIRTRADIVDFAERLEHVPRQVFWGGTAPGDAILYGIQSIEGNGYSGTRRVIDVSGDDGAKDGLPAEVGRDRAVAAGMTVNGLPILEGLPWLEVYFRENVIGGSGAFSIPALGFADFGVAVRKKLIREIAGGPGRVQTAWDPPAPIPAPPDGADGRFWGRGPSAAGRGQLRAIPTTIRRAKAPNRK